MSGLSLYSLSFLISASMDSRIAPLHAWSDTGFMLKVGYIGKGANPVRKNDASFYMPGVMQGIGTLL